MRLFLSSQDLGNYPEVAAKLAGNNKKLAYIRNAMDDKPPEERNASKPEKVKMFEDAGFEFEEIDLREFFGKSHELKVKLKNFGTVWCAGGNTFILRRALAASGLDKLILERLKKDSIMYGGWSAGACVTAPSLRGIDQGDRPHPEDVPDAYPSQEIIWDGLNLVPFMVVPHCDQDWFKPEAEATIKYLKEHHIDYKALNDGQVIVIDGEKMEILT